MSHECERTWLTRSFSQLVLASWQDYKTITSEPQTFKALPLLMKRIPYLTKLKLRSSLMT